MKHKQFSVEPVREIHTPVVIERTAKIYKLGMIAGWALMIISGLMTLYSFYVFNENNCRIPSSFSEFLTEQPAVYVSLGGIVLGFLIYRFEKVLAWWNNG